MGDKFIELTASDDGKKVAIFISNIAWLKGEESGTMIAFNYLSQNTFPFVLRVKEDYSKVKKLLT
jgi:hypothetical protein